MIEELVLPPQNTHIQPLAPQCHSKHHHKTQHPCQLNFLSTPENKWQKITHPCQLNFSLNPKNKWHKVTHPCQSNFIKSSK